MGSGTRLKILEAMAMKKPVVSTTIGAEGIECTDKENILLADDEKYFAQKVILLLQDERLRKSLALKGYELVLHQYDVENVRRIFQANINTYNSNNIQLENCV
jgi:glycosyltransferase involved in cell wall biosynthesis